MAVGALMDGELPQQAQPSDVLDAANCGHASAGRPLGDIFLECAHYSTVNVAEVPARCECGENNLLHLRLEAPPASKVLLQCGVPAFLLPTSVHDQPLNLATMVADDYFLGHDNNDDE